VRATCSESLGDQPEPAGKSRRVNPTIGGFRPAPGSRHGEENGEDASIDTQVLRAGLTKSRSVWIAALALPFILIAPAPWNGYPLLQWDTGGYLARWYEGYLVPSRSTVFGLYLHDGEVHSHFRRDRKSATPAL